MNEGHHAQDGWPQQMQHLLMHGRDREASELAARHLLDDPTHTEPRRPDGTTIARLEQLEPLRGGVASGISPDASPGNNPLTSRACGGPPDSTSTTQPPPPNTEHRASLDRPPEPQRSRRMNPNKALWEKGDFTRIAETMRESGKELVDWIGVTEGLKVLDLGCGDGTTALPAAQLGAEVLGVDIARNLVEAGNRRAKEAGLTNLTIKEGDATDLGELADDRFDLVVSIFGAMFAPRPFDVAQEMVRVTRPGGRIVMGNWIPGDPTLVAQILRISSAYAPPPPEGFVSPMTWGITDDVVERFAAAGIPKAKVSCAPETFVFDAPVPPKEFLGLFRTYYGPTMNAFEAAEANGRADALLGELEGLFEAQNQSPTERQTYIPATYLRVTVEV